MSYRSKSFSKFHFLVLVANLLVTLGMAVVNYFYYFSPDYYYEWFAKLDFTLMAYHKSLFVLLHVSFLIWMFMVHMAVANRFPLYSVTPGGFIVRMLPFAQVWGLASTFNQLRLFFARYTALSRIHPHFKVYIPLIYTFYILSIATTGVVHDEEGADMLFMAFGLFVWTAMLVVFLMTTHAVNQCLSIAVQEEPMLTEEEKIRASTPVLYTGTSTSSSYRPSVLVPPHLQAASRGARFAAKLIDTFVFILLFAVMFIPAIAMDEEGDGTLAMGIFFLLLISWVVYLAVHLSISGQTIGKWLLRIKIVRMHTGENGGFVYNFLLRSVVNYMIGAFVPFYGIVDACVIFTSDSRCVHDLIAGTVVVNVNPVSLSASPSAPPLSADFERNTYDGS